MPFSELSQKFKGNAISIHAHTPVLRNLPIPALAIIIVIAFINALIWVAIGIVLVQYPTHPSGLDVDILTAEAFPWVRPLALVFLSRLLVVIASKLWRPDGSL
jgi:hypothetical protein